MLRKNWIKLLMIMSPLISSCALTVPAIEVCHNRGTTARCTNIVTRKARIIEDWPAKSIGYFCESPKDYGEIKKFIKKACQKTTCNVPEIEKTLKEIESK